MRDVNNEILKPYIERSVNDILISVSNLLLDKLVSIYYNYLNRELYFYIFTNDSLDDDEIEEFRVAQTEVFSDFPDGEIGSFLIEVYTKDDKGKQLPKIPGILAYQADGDPNWKTKKYSLTHCEIASEDPEYSYINKGSTIF